MGNEKLLVYTTQWCADWQRVRQYLDQNEIAYVVIDIERFPEAIPIVLHVNDGKKRVPTLIFPDGSTLTEPSLRILARKFDRNRAV